jgi:hypothetical protein
LPLGHTEGASQQPPPAQGGKESRVTTATAAQKSNGIIARPPRPNRMTLSAVMKGVVVAPYRMVVHGTDGVGKSTFAADAPAPIFLGAEDGTGHLDVARFPAPESWLDILDAVRTLTNETHEFKTLAVDSLDWVEPHIWQAVCDSAGVDNIEAVGGGFMKGYVAALDLWRTLLASLERLQAAKGMHVILIAHTQIKPFKNPEGDDYERYVLKLHDKAAGLCREWSKAVYFANYETFAVKEKSKRVKGVSTGARLLYTQRTAAYDAKDRYGVPESFPLSWADFDAAAKAASPADPKALASEIDRKAKQLGGEIESFAAAYLEEHAGDASALAKLNDRLNGKLAEKREQEGN